MAEAGLSAFEGVQEFDFGKYYSLAIEWDGKEAKAENKKKLAERKLKLAEKRLKAAESDDLGERVERATWIRLFLKEAESAQMRLDDLQLLAEDAKRDLEPFNKWLQARHNEWDEFSEEGKRLVRLEVGSAEHQDRMKKRKELGKKEHEARMTRFRAEEEVEFAEEGYKAARLDNLGEIVERAALIKVVQEEVRSAQTQFEKATESTEKIGLKRKVLSELGWLPCIKRKIKRLIVLLEWIEQQRREIAANCAPTQKKGGQDRSKRASSRAPQNRPATEAFRPNKPPKANSRERKQSTTRSILSPVDSAKVFKGASKRRSSLQKMSVLCDTSQAAEKTTTDISTESRSQQAFKVKHTMPASLRPIHSSRNSKPGGTRPTKVRRDGTKDYI